MDKTNPLHEFRSYSYHHVLIACKDLAAAEKLTLGFSDKLRDEVGAVQKPETFKVFDGDHVVVVNGFKDGEAFIKDAEWETMFAPISSKGKRYKSTTMNLEGELTIVEPKGFSFLEVINNVSSKLKVDNCNITWVLKTVFVGYTQKNQVEYIATVKPLLFHIYDLQAKFDVMGSEYYLKFVGLSNGSSKMPGYNNTSVVSVTLGSDKTLGDAISQLQYQLNLNYNKEVDALVDRCKKNGLELKGRRITYTVTLHDDYVDYPVDNVVLAQRGNIDTSGNVTFKKGASVEQMIHSIMRSSKQIGSDASAGKGEVDTIFKVFGSTKHSGDDSGTTEIHFDIRKYDVPKSTTDGASVNNGVSDAIEYEYMYTGQNVDILDFDMRMEMGLGLLQLMTVHSPLQNTNAVTGEPEDTVESQESATAGGTGKTAKLDNTPKPASINVGTIYPSKKYDEKYAKGVVEEGKSASFDTLLSKHSQLETLGVTIKVIGNPLVLNDLNIVPSDISSGSTGSTPFGNWITSPPLAKVKVMIPSDPNALVVNDKFAKEFWYKGFYRILSTRQQFNSGMFTQVHEMMSMELEDPVVTSEPKATGE